jgi:pimeloyl-ACP methyl ester carboxylesterase
MDIGGMNILYEVQGKGESMLLLHGAGSIHAMWDFMVPILANSFKVITCDLRGHGDSDKGDPSKYSIELFADDVMALLDGLATEKVHLIGYSMGGLVAGQLALTHPGRFYDLVLGGTPTKVPKFFKAMVSMVRLAMKSNRIASIMLREVPKDRRSHVVKVTREMFSKAGEEVFAADVDASRAFLGKLPGLSSISIPVLLVYGGKDSLEGGEELHKLLPMARLVIIEGATHGLTAEKPEEFARQILDFCRGGT